MTFQISYRYTFSGITTDKTQEIEAASKEAAVSRFLFTKPGVKQENILSIIERVTVSPKIWTNPETGKSVKFYPVINHLKIGQPQAITSSDLLALLGQEDNDSNRRQLRAAIDYYLIEEGVQICVTSDGYFIASSKEDLLLAASEKEMKANSLLRSAARLRSRAEAMV